MSYSGKFRGGQWEGREERRQLAALGVAGLEKSPQWESGIVMLVSFEECAEF